jgi:hypothetical protein
MTQRKSILKMSIGIENISNFVRTLDGSPLNSIPLRNTSVAELYQSIMKSLPADLANVRREHSVNIEIFELDDTFLKDIIDLSDHDIGSLYESEYHGQKFKKPLHMTIRELFFQKIVEYGLSYRDPRSYQFLDILTFTSSQYTDLNGETLYREPTRIKLSTLLGHRFDGEEYSFKEQHSSYVVLKRSNLKFFTNVLRMMRYLDRKDYSLYIDYPQYYMILDNEQEFVQPFSLSELHRNHNQNGDCTYYSNYWFESDKNKSIHSNSIMAILSYLKHGMKTE